MARALVSVFDKTGIVEFAKGLSDLGYEVVSTGGTLRSLLYEGVRAVDVTTVTGFPEMLDGRVKTLHPKLHAGILAVRDNPEHMSTIAEHGIQPVDIVVCNLYPFKQTIAKDGVTLSEAVENIDIGGPSMLRAAAKNYRDVIVITDPADYGAVLEGLRNEGLRNEGLRGGGLSDDFKFKLAAKVFRHTAAYDALIAGYLTDKAGVAGFTDTLTMTFERRQDLRYGENPHQDAVFYQDPIPPAGSLPTFKQLHGKELSFCNINDLQGAVELCKEFDGVSAAVVAVKHSTPCGVGEAGSVAEAWDKAYNADPTSVFGGIVAVNKPVDEVAAESMSKIFLEIIAAPSFTAGALEILTKKKNIRLLELDFVANKGAKALDFKKTSGGLLVQRADDKLLPELPFKVVTDRAPTEKELADLTFAWKLVKHVKSNGIAMARDGQSLGLGGGQTNRVWACKQAAEHAAEALGEGATANAALASDAFFPFPDCVEVAKAAGITAIIQPGGSVNDQASIDKCNEYNIAMVFTGMRHFRH